MRILHLREPDVGGVQIIVQQYAANTPELEHVVVHTTPRRSSVAWVSAADNTALSPLADRSLSLPPPFALSRLVREVRPDVVHAHSSWAGMYARTTPLLGVPIVYTPHCFAFERLDLSARSRAVLRRTESRLLGRTKVLAAASRREAALARSLRSPVPCAVVEVPHAAPSERGPIRERAGSPLVVGCVGRIAPQKRPDVFLDLVRAARRRGLDCRFVWLGDGDDAVAAALRDDDVEVTGWLEQDRAIERTRSLDALVHVADWEVGDPLVCLEAAAQGLPVGYRHTASSEHNVVGTMFDGVEAGVDWLAALVNAEVYQRSSAASLDQVALFDSETQGQLLREVYGLALT